MNKKINKKIKAHSHNVQFYYRFLRTVATSGVSPFFFFFTRAQASKHGATKTSSGFPPRGPKGKYSILSWEPMVGSVSRLSPIEADCCSHVAIPISAVSSDSTTASVTLWYYFKQLLLLFNSIHHLLPPHLASSFVTCLRCPLPVIRRLLSSQSCRLLSSSPPTSAVSVRCCRIVCQIVWSCCIVHRQPSAR